MLLPTLRRSALTTRPLTSTTARTPLRALSSTPTRFARKDTQHKDSLKPEPNEYSKSGSDDAAAAVENAAFDPKQTRPETEKASAEKESGDESPQTSPLDVSPANHEVSSTKTKNEGATGNPAGGQVTKDRGSQTSGGSGAPKSGSGKYGGGSAN